MITPTTAIANNDDINVFLKFVLQANKKYSKST